MLQSQYFQRHSSSTLEDPISNKNLNNEPQLHAAQEIRNGKITRHEGVELVKKYDEEFPKKYFDEFLKYIDIDELTFYQTIDKFRSPHLWEKNGEDWNLCHAVWKDA